MVILYSRQGVALQPTSRTTTGRPYSVRDRKCVRCGGLGGSERWRHTGWTCHRCAGKGVDPVRETVKLYTAEQNAKLDAAAEKRAAKNAVLRAEKERLEQIRRDAERAEIISANEGFIARLDAELAHGEVEIIRSIRDRIVEQAKEPTDRQVEVANQIIDRNTAERIRLASARHVGEIKERRDFTLTFLRYRYSRGELPNGITIDNHWSLFTDENGCKIACKSAPWTIGLRQTVPEGGTWADRCYEKGSVVRVKATVVKHEIDGRGEPVTYINRPKEIA